MGSFNSNNQLIIKSMINHKVSDQLIIKSMINSDFYNALKQWDNLVAVTIRYLTRYYAKKRIHNYA